MKRLVIIALTLLLGLPALAQQRRPAFPDLDRDTRAAIVDSVTAALDTVYVFPDVATAMVADVRRRFARGEYDDFADPAAFADRLTEDLRTISHDLHLRVGIAEPPPPGELEDPALARQHRLEEARRDNFGFVKVERMAGNVGYLKLDGFSGAPEAGPTASAAMTFLSGCDAIIIDLTENGGGSPSMIQLLTSYLVEPGTHLNSFYVRATDDMQQFWTLPFVPGVRNPDALVYVLTSGRTFSAAEEFTYNLKNLERATIVGETTGGGAHPVDRHFFDFGAYHVTMSLPFGRAVNPITGTNWEGTGIEPHLACASADAFTTAYLQALEDLAEDCDDEGQRYELTWARDGLKADLAPVSMSTRDLDQLVGRYGPRQIRREDDLLIYQRDGRDPLVLRAMGDDTFGVEGLDWFRLRFERDDRGRVQRLVGLYRSGRTDENARDR
ncbi:MAG: S41 family peptidase [Candidatus Krumholzibacteriia bacterium]